MEQSIYKIVANSMGRNILVINQYVDVENSSEIQEEMFDIVLIQRTPLRKH